MDDFMIMRVLIQSLFEAIRLGMDIQERRKKAEVRCKDCQKAIDERRNGDESQAA